MRVHFISIGGAVMHNLAIALHKKKYIVSGSDDEIFNPAKERLKKYNLLPDAEGWFPEKVTSKLDVIILGMHAKKDNPEILKARELKLKIYSFPEFLYEQTKTKKRVVIGGSHGKTTITSMVMHVLKNNDIKFDYMVGAQLDGFETMVGLSENSKIAVFEGDEYLSSALDRRPKFLLYKPHIALLSGIAWDHINVFPTIENYLDQFEKFIALIENKGTLIYFNEDIQLKKIVLKARKDITKISYTTHKARTTQENTILQTDKSEVPFTLFGSHNLQNIMGAKLICNELGISDEAFYEVIATFKGAAKRLQLVASDENCNIYHDFAHAPSKLKASVKAVKEQFPDKKLIACMELHTYSSLNKKFLSHYAQSMNIADIAIVFFDPHAIKLKGLENILPEDVKKAFENKDLIIFNNANEFKEYLNQINYSNSNLLLMSSGNFAGIDIQKLASEILTKVK